MCGLTWNKLSGPEACRALLWGWAFRGSRGVCCNDQAHVETPSGTWVLGVVVSSGPSRGADEDSPHLP